MNRLKRANFALTALAIVALAATLGLLFWLRARTARSLEDGVAAAVRLFDPSILGDPTDPTANFEAAEALAVHALGNPAIRRVVVTKWMPSRPEARREAPIVPYDLMARGGSDWLAGLAGMRRAPLRLNAAVCGYVYFDLDRSAIRTVSWAIAAVAAALVAALLGLVARLFTQETTIQKVGLELERRRSELIRLERLALAGQLSANLLHDLKKPVLNLRHQIEDLRPGDSPPAGAAEEMRGQLSLFFQMLSDSGIERFVRSERLSEEWVDLGDILRQSARLVHYERGEVEIVEKLGEGLPPVLAQPYRLVQVFSNLILNAYQAMGGRGTLTLETRAVEGGVEASVNDSGPGIPPEALQSIFEPFFTTKGEAEGTGLGLAISRLIIDELKGRIEVESRPGGPTTFRVRLPI